MELTMDADKLIALLPNIVTPLVSLIAERDHVDEDTALRNLYASKLYQDLEIEETKVWHYSAETLYTLYREEKETGEITYPEV